MTPLARITSFTACRITLSIDAPPGSLTGNKILDNLFILIYVCASTPDVEPVNRHHTSPQLSIHLFQPQIKMPLLWIIIDAGWKNLEIFWKSQRSTETALVC
jgi:hypothetical protein